MTLVEAILNVGNSDNLGVYATYPFSSKSIARIGQRQFENGGLLDDMVFFASGSSCQDFIERYMELDEDTGDDFVLDNNMVNEAAETMIEEWNTDIDGSILI